MYIDQSVGVIFKHQNNKVLQYEDDTINIFKELLFTNL